MDPKHYAGMAAMGIACIALALFQNDPVAPGDRDGLTPPSTEVAAGVEPVTGDIPEGLAPVKIETKKEVKKPSKKPTKPKTAPKTTTKPKKADPVAKTEEPTEVKPKETTSVARTGDGPSIKGVVTWKKASTRTP